MKAKTGLSLGWILKHLGIGRTTFHRWQDWKPTDKKGFVHPSRPLKSEEEAVIAYAEAHVGTGYKKLTYQMLDEGVVVLTPAQVYPILCRENLLDRWNRTTGGAAKEY